MGASAHQESLDAWAAAPRVTDAATRAPWCPSDFRCRASRRDAREGGWMGKGRLEAFSDGVIAILITIMVLELRPPEDTTLDALRPLVPVFLSYVLSFTY